MKRYLYLFPLMAFTAATLALGACDDKKDDATTAEQTTVAPETATDTTTAPAAITVSAIDAKAFATAPGATTGAVFLTLINNGTETDKLVGASTDVASTVEIHESSVSPTGTMEMRKVDGVEIGAGQQATLSPEGYHIMLMGLTAPLTQGQMFTVTLDFDKSADVVVPVTVTPAGAPAAVAPDASATGGVAPDAATSTPETITPPADGTVPTTPTTEAPATDVPTGGDATTQGEAPVSEDTMEEPTTAQ